jgi:plasmid stabilization system protein ParE
MLGFGAGEYIIRYRQEANRVLIVRVRHSKEEDFQQTPR